MDRYFKGLPFEKVTVDGQEYFKSTDGRFFKIDEGKTFVAIECAGNEDGLRINDFEDVDLFDKENESDDLIEDVREVLKELVA